MLPTNNHPHKTISKKDPSWLRRAAYRLGLSNKLPLPRRVRRDDPDLMQFNRKLRRQRQSDAARLPTLQRDLAAAVQARDTVRAQTLVAAIYQTLYGHDGTTTKQPVTPQTRQAFLERFGCTGWNADILATLGALGDGRGFVEVGAGHGQWARALSDWRSRRYQEALQRYEQAVQENDPTATRPTVPHPRTFVKAYDNGSRLPLNPQIYHNTVPQSRYFGQVLPCHDVGGILSQWEHRHRILLLVYPPPVEEPTNNDGDRNDKNNDNATNDLAWTALQAYTAVGGDTLVYVGEPKGGANASDAFFDALVADEWILTHVLPGVPCGDKGAEKVFILQRRVVKA